MSDPSTQERQALSDGPQAADGQPRSLSLPRVDGPHTLGDQRAQAAGPAQPEVPAADVPGGAASPVAGNRSASEAERVELQARQLSEVLRQRFEDLERREAAVNRQLAGIDRHARAQQLELDEREAELAQREEQLAERAGALEDQLRELAVDRAALERREHALTEQTGLLAIEASEWNEKARQLAVREAALETERQQAVAAATAQGDEIRQAAETERSRILAAAAAAAAQAHETLQAELHASRQQSVLDLAAARNAVQHELTALRTAAVEEIAEAWDQIEARKQAEPPPAGEQQSAVDGQPPAGSRLVADAQELRARRRQPDLPETPADGGDARGQNFEQLAAELARREGQIAEAETWLAERRSEIEQLRADLQAERGRADAQLRVERRRLAEASRRLEAEMRQKREAFQRQSEQLELRRASVEHSQHELAELHRETLELRLSTEELWAQLAGTVPPAALSHALGQTRARLDDQHRLTLQKIEAGRNEVDHLRTELAEVHGKLQQQTCDLEAWAQRRNDELNERAAALAAREAELEASQRANGEARQAWLAERLELERELREAGEQLRKATAASRFACRSGMESPRVAGTGGLN